MLPILFEIGPFTLYSLWAISLIGFIIGALIFLKRAKHERLNLSLILDHSFSLLIGVILFSRVIFFITNWGYFSPLSIEGFFKHVIFFWKPGFSFWGGVIGALLFLYYHCRRNNESIVEWINAMIIPFLVGIMIGNIGQLLDGQGYGNETILPWGISFESTNVKYTVPVHPTQLYSFFAILLILLTKKYVQKKCRFLVEEKIWTLFAINTYALSRFIIEFFRGDDTLQFGPVRIGYITSFLLFVVTAYFLYSHVVSSKSERNDIE